jgi:hypothetical protein
MRPVKHDDGLNSAVPATNPLRNINLKRRGFLLTLGVGGAGAAAVATAHVQTYYKTAKV